MKLALGGAQFGLNYGISNKQGKTSREEIARILNYANEMGITLIDTAPLYGESESVIGEVIGGENHFAIVTKSPKFSSDCLNSSDAVVLEESFYNSLKRLGRNKIYGFLIHNADNLLTKGGEYLMNKLLELKSLGLVKKIGVSVYSREQIEKILSYFKLDLIQLPINVFDQRFLDNDYLVTLKNLGLEIHGRSVFLQGLLLMPLDELPGYFSPIKERIKDYHTFIASQKLSLVETALGFVLGIKELDRIICGVNNLSQLKELLGKAKPLEKELFFKFAVNEDSFINPSRWVL